MNRQIVSILAFAAITSWALNPAQAGLINGSFEAPDLGYNNFVDYQPGVGTIPGWTVEAGSVDIERGLGLTAADGGQYLDMNGVNAGTISQVTGATAGQTYQLSFALSGLIDSYDGVVYGSSAGNSIDYQLYDGNTNTVLAYGSYLVQTSNLYAWTTIDLDATATSNRLGVRLYSDGAGVDVYFGPIIDNVILSPTAGPLAVPEPSSFSLTAMAGVMALGYLRRNRRAR